MVKLEDKVSHKQCNDYNHYSNYSPLVNWPKISALMEFNCRKMLTENILVSFTIEEQFL